MQKLIEYCANLLGIDISNPYVIADIAEIQNLEAFIAFTKANIKNTRLDYLNPLQKLNELKQMFNEEQNQNRENSAMSEAQALAMKLRAVKTMIKNELMQGKPIDYDCLKKEGEDYFTKFEQKTLKGVGSIRRVCDLDDQFTLEEAINKVFLGVIYQPKNIENKSNASMIALASVKSF